MKDIQINNSSFSIPGDNTELTFKQKAVKTLEGIKDAIVNTTDALIFYPLDPLLEVKLKSIAATVEIKTKIQSAIESAKTGTQIAAKLAEEIAPEIPGLIAAMPETTTRLARTVEGVVSNRIRETLHNISTIPQRTKKFREEIQQYGIVEVLDRDDATTA